MQVVGKPNAAYELADLIIQQGERGV